MTRGRVTLAAVAGLAIFYVGPAAADCGGPGIDAAVRERRLVVEGTGWGTACNDTGTGTCSDAPPLGDPVDDIEISLLHRGRVIEQHVVDADDDYDVGLTFDAELGPGRYEVSANAGGTLGDGNVRVPVVVPPTD